jgi:hypothetical protein
MVLGVLAAPLLARSYQPWRIAQISAVLLVGGGVTAAVCLARKRAEAGELEAEPTDAPGTLNARVPEFDLELADGESVELAELLGLGPTVLVLMPSSPGDDHVGMVAELVRDAAEHGETVNVIGRSLPVGLWDGGAMRLLRDPLGSAERALGMTGEGLRRRSRGGVFVIDGGGVLRFAYVPAKHGEWIPASFVRGRLARMRPAVRAPEVHLTRTVLTAAPAAAATPEGA